MDQGELLAASGAFWIFAAEAAESALVSVQVLTKQYKKLWTVTAVRAEDLACVGPIEKRTG